MYNRDKAKNEKVVRAIALGLATVMAATPVMEATTVYAEENPAVESTENTNPSLAEQMQNANSDVNSHQFADAKATLDKAEKSETIAGATAILTVGQGIISDEISAVKDDVKAENHLKDAVEAYEDGTVETAQNIIDSESKLDSASSLIEEALSATEDFSDESEDLNDAAEDIKDKAKKAVSAAEDVNDIADAAKKVVSDEAAYADAKATYEEAAKTYESAKKAAEDAVAESADEVSATEEKKQAAIDAYQAAKDAYDLAKTAYETAEQAAADAQAEAEKALAEGIEDAEAATAKAEEAAAKAAELKEKAETAKETADQWVIELGGEDSPLAQAKGNLAQAAKDLSESFAAVEDDIKGEDGVVKTGDALAKADAALAQAAVAEVQAVTDVAAKAAALAELEVKKVAAETALNIAKAAIEKEGEITDELKASLDAAEAALAETQRIYDEAHDALYGKYDEDGNLIAKGAIQNEEDAKLAKEAAEQRRAEVEALEKSEVGKEYTRLENEVTEANKELAELPEDADEETRAAAEAKVNEAKQNLVISAISHEITKDGENDGEKIIVSTVEVVGTDVDNNNSTVYKVTFTDGSEVYYQSVENEDNTISLYDYNFTEDTNVVENKTALAQGAKDLYVDSIVRNDGTKGQEGVDYVVETVVEHEDAEYTVVQNTANVSLSISKPFTYQSQLSELYGHKADNVKHYVLVDGTEYEAIIIKEGPVYYLNYINADGEQVGLDVQQNWNAELKELTTSVNVKESDLGNYQNVVGDPMKTKDEVAAEYNVTYYDVDRTEEGKKASEIAASVNGGNGLTEEQIEALANGETVLTNDYRIVEKTPAEDAEYEYTYDVTWTESYTEDENTTVANLGADEYEGKTVQTTDGNTVTYNENTGKYEYTELVTTTRYYYIDFRGRKHYSDKFGGLYILPETTTNEVTHELGDTDEVVVLSVDKTRDMSDTISKEEYDKAIAEGTKYDSAKENATCTKEAVEATYDVVYYNSRDRYNEIAGNEGDGSYTDMTARRTKAEQDVENAKNDYKNALEALAGAKAVEVKDGANLALKKSDYEVKKDLYDAAANLNEKMQNAYDEKKAAYDAYYEKRKVDDDNVLEAAASGANVVVQLVKAGLTKEEAQDILKAIKTGNVTEIGGDVIIKIVDSGAYDNDFLTQFEKDVLVATANLAKSAKNLTEATENLKSSAEAWAKAAGAHEDSLKNLNSSLQSMNKAAGTVLVEALKVGVEDAKLAAAYVAQDAANAAYCYLSAVSERADKAAADAKAAEDALKALELKNGVTDEQLEEARAHVEETKAELDAANEALYGKYDEDGNLVENGAIQDAEAAQAAYTDAATEVEKLSEIKISELPAYIAPVEDPKEDPEKNPEEDPKEDPEEDPEEDPSRNQTPVGIQTQAGSVELDFDNMEVVVTRTAAEETEEEEVTEEAEGIEVASAEETTDVAAAEPTMVADEELPLAAKEETEAETNKSFLNWLWLLLVAVLAGGYTAKKQYDKKASTEKI